MFSLFKGAPKPPPGPPELEVTDFQQGKLEVRSPKPLANGTQLVNLKLPEDDEIVAATINVESGEEAEKIYWATVVDPEYLPHRLKGMFQQFEAAPVEPVFEEKRSEVRAAKVLGIMSRDIPGFKTVCHDVSSKGVRIVSEKELPTGRPITFRLDLDDHRVDPLELVGDIMWCGPKDPKTWWIGVKYTRISPKQQALIDKFLAESREIEHGVITRDYAAD
jgi:hypothetical protein